MVFLPPDYVPSRLNFIEQVLVAQAAMTGGTTVSPMCDGWPGVFAQISTRLVTANAHAVQKLGGTPANTTQSELSSSGQLRNQAWLQAVVQRGAGSSKPKEWSPDEASLHQCNAAVHELTTSGPDGHAALAAAELLAAASEHAADWYANADQMRGSGFRLCSTCYGCTRADAKH